MFTHKEVVPYILIEPNNKPYTAIEQCMQQHVLNLLLYVLFWVKETCENYYKETIKKVKQATEWRDGKAVLQECVYSMKCQLMTLMVWYIHFVDVS